jgi:hypothetical protein
LHKNIQILFTHVKTKSQSNSKTMATKAKESPQVEKARKKLEQQLKASEKCTNAEALNKMDRLIQEQLKRQKSNRISLKKKQIASFGDTKHSAKVKSHFILKLIKKIENDKKQVPTSPLEGRITAISNKNYD